MFRIIDVRGRCKKHSIGHVLPSGVGWEVSVSYNTVGIRLYSCSLIPSVLYDPLRYAFFPTCASGALAMTSQGLVEAG